ncbi:hypothetical protein HOO68_05420 [Candidatus Gracilibacteria bacterium]|nr:hypothetical protein [Candidatus Gracilibacteria bacterium]
MVTKSPESSSSVLRAQEKSPDVSQELFGMYKKRYLIEKKGITDKIYDQIKNLLGLIGSTPEKTPEPKYDELRLSHIAREYLDKNHTELKGENPDRACLIIYFPGGSKEKSNAKQICIPRTNPDNKTLQVSGFTLVPVPKSNGYNTEYIIKDKDGGLWNQLAILFPAENPKYTRKRLLQEEQILLKKEIIASEKTLSYLPQKKKEERENLGKKIRGLQEKFTQNRPKIDAIGNQERYIHFTYIPYRESLNTEKNRKQGFDYLADTMQKTYEHSVGKKTLGSMRSNISGIPIAEAIPWQYPGILNLIERMDFEVYFDSTGKALKSKDSIDSLMGTQLSKSLTTFGVNTSDAFNWQRSKVGAQGVGQIMPETYQLFHNPVATEKYPNPERKYMPLFPEPDFDIAARDHETSFRLQIAHFDNQIFQFPDTIKKNWKELISSPKTSIGIVALLAAGYNGSMTRIMEEVFGKEYKKSSLDIAECKQKLSVKNIVTAMDRAKERDIAAILETRKQKPYQDKKTKKLVQPPDLPLTQEQQEKIQKRTATYKESMTYVLKADYVWQYLSKKYPDKFNG